MKASESVVFANGEVGPLTTAGTFMYEVEKAENDQYGNMVTTVKCHGKVTSETAWELREAVKPLLALGWTHYRQPQRCELPRQLRIGYACWAEEIRSDAISTQRC